MTKILQIILGLLMAASLFAPASAADELLPVEELRDHLGPAITAAAAEMPDGSSAVFARRGRWLVVRVVAKERSYVSDLGSIRNRVLLDYRRHLADTMLRDYLNGLRDRADIRVAVP